MYSNNINVDFRYSFIFFGIVCLIQFILPPVAMVYHDDLEEQNDLEGPEIHSTCILLMFICVLFAKMIRLYTRGKTSFIFIVCLFLTYRLSSKCNMEFTR